MESIIISFSDLEAAGSGYRGLSHNQRRWDQNTLWSLLRLGRELEGKLAGDPSQLRRSMVDRAQWHPQVVRITKVSATDEGNVLGDPQSRMQALRRSHRPPSGRYSRTLRRASMGASAAPASPEIRLCRPTLPSARAQRCSSPEPAACSPPGRFDNPATCRMRGSCSCLRYGRSAGVRSRSSASWPSLLPPRRRFPQSVPPDGESCDRREGTAYGHRRAHKSFADSPGTKRSGERPLRGSAACESPAAPPQDLLQRRRESARGCWSSKHHPAILRTLQRTDARGPERQVRSCRFVRWPVPRAIMLG